MRTGGETVWMNGSVGRQDSSGLNPEYLYAAPVRSTGEWVAYQWANHLAPRDLAMVLPGATKAAEYAASELWGTISLVGIERSDSDNAMVEEPGIRFIRTWRSTDDGQTWTTCPSATCAGPFGDNTTTARQSSDPSTAIGPDGRAFAVAVRPPIPVNGVSDNADDWVDIAAWNSTSGTWSSPVQIPGTRAEIADREWFAVDPTAAGRFYLSFTGSDNITHSGDGRLTYCTEEYDGTCVTPNPTGWCSPIPLHSASRCDGNTNGASGCPVVVGEDGTAWVAVQDDNDCPVGSSANPPGYSTLETRAVGIRRVAFNATTHCPSDAVLVNCIRYAVPGAVAPVDAFGRDREWFARFSASRDGSNRLSFATRSFRDVQTGGPCDSHTSTTVLEGCRSDVFVAYRDWSLGKWCGTSCVVNPFPDTMLRVTAPGETAPLATENYFLPGLAMLDQGILGVTWLHGTTNLAGFGFDVYLGSLRRQSADSTLLQDGIERQWSHTTGVDASSTTAWFGDFTDPAPARLHAHFFDPYLPAQFSTSPVSTLWSPAVQAAGP